MNKKILSLAVAAAVAAPMAAQAEVSVNGAVSRDMYTDSTKTGLVGGDSGTSKLEINVKEGDAFAKAAWDIRGAAMPSTFTTTGSGTFTNYAMPAREQMAGVKVGGVSISIGRHANAYNGGVKVDTMTANFLEARNRPGGVAKVPSFVSGLLGISGNAGDVSYAVQYGPAYSDMAKDAGGTATNPVAANVKFKAGPATVGVGYWGDTGGNSTVGISGKMKFGDIAVAVSYENADGAWINGTTAGNTNNEIFADVSMPMGSGTIGLGLGSNTDASTTFSRVSYQMKMGSAKVTVGGNNADGDTRFGAGLAVSF